MLEEMAAAARDYGCHAVFKAPAMNQIELSNIMTSLSNSSTASKTEVTDLGSMKMREVKDVQREKANVVESDVINQNEWWYGTTL